MFSFKKPNPRTIISTAGEALKGVESIVFCAQLTDLTFNMVNELIKLASHQAASNSTNTFFPNETNGTNCTPCAPDELLQISDYGWMIGSGLGSILVIGSAISHYGFNLFHQQSSGHGHSHGHIHHDDNERSKNHSIHSIDYGSAQTLNLDSDDDDHVTEIVHEQSSLYKHRSNLKTGQKIALGACATAHATEAGGAVVLVGKIISTFTKSPFSFWGEAALTGGAMAVGALVGWADYQPCADSMEKLNEEEMKSKLTMRRK